MENQSNFTDFDSNKVDPSQINQPHASIQEKTKLVPLLLTILITAIVFGVGGYLIGLKINSLNQPNNVSTKDMPAFVPPPTVLPEATKPPISVTDSTMIYASDLESTLGWRTVSYPQNILAGQDGSTKPGKIEFQIPSSWSVNEVTSEACAMYVVSNDDESLRLQIKPICGLSNNDYLPLSGSIQIVGLTPRVGNDGHDSYTVRFLEKEASSYHYGTIGVSPGAAIDISSDQIYPHLVLHYQPDRLEQWLWTSVDMTYSENSGSKVAALRSADTIISTLKLVD